MTKCVTCHSGSVQERLVPEYKADLLGAPFPVLLIDSVKEEFCLTCGEKTKTTIPDMDSLLHMVAAARAVIPQKLSGTEIRFMRNALGLKAKDIAASLEMSPENFSRVESDAKPLGPQSEKLFRVLVIMKLFEDKRLEHDALTRVAKAVDVKIAPFWSANQGFAIHMRHQSIGDMCSDDDANGRWLEAA